MKPSNFIINPMGSTLQKSEAETIARNIMVILSRTGDTFRPLSWEEYKKERSKDGDFSSGEASYFDVVIDYCKSPDTARLFSPVWEQAYLKADKTTTNSETQYLEPVGFKGSKGRWYLQPAKKHIFPIIVLGGVEGGFIPRVCINETDTREKGSFEATAQLISQSKELAKALQELLKYTPKFIGYPDRPEIANAKQVLKDAGLTDK